jgi:hypothetical protein
MQTMPAPVNNRNAVRHGLYAQHLGKGNNHIRRVASEFRRALESAVLAEYSEIDVVNAGVIQSACRWEVHSLLAAKWLRQNPDMPVGEKLKFSREIAKGSSERDKCIAMLRLSAGKTDAWQAIFAAGAPQIAPIQEHSEETNGKERKSSSPLPTPDAEIDPAIILEVPPASPSEDGTAPEAPESPVTSADAKPTDDTN